MTPQDHDRILILGSTGSIGCQTLDVVRQHPDRFRVQTLVAGKNWKTLVEQAMEFRPHYVVIGDDSLYLNVKEALYDIDEIHVMAGRQAVLDVCKIRHDRVVSALVGIVGLEPTAYALSACSVLALANKESMVCAGPLLNRIAQEFECKIIPVDSEHNAMFQLMRYEDRLDIDKVLITASGGPFRAWPLSDLVNVTPTQAVAHPNWSMGAKISVDSATLMNKGLELIEAHYLFDWPMDSLDAIIHPQSKIHAMVMFRDGSILSHLAEPDMRIPIAYALGYPKRLPLVSARFDPETTGSLTFEAIDLHKFPCFGLAKQAQKQGLYACVAMNAANEMAVDSFLKGRIRFTDIAKIIDSMLEKCEPIELSSIQDIVQYDQEIRARNSNIKFGGGRQQTLDTQ